MKNIALLICGSLLTYQTSLAQQISSTALDKLSAFAFEKGSWVEGAGIQQDYKTLKPKLQKGAGVLVYTPSKGSPDLVSIEPLHGDTEIEFDFMTTNGSKASFYLNGQYKINLSDSWSEAAEIQKVGTVTMKSAANESSFHWREPLSHVAKAPGLWQHLKIKFKAPQFDASEKKTKNATLAELYLNGVLIHQNLEILEPSSGSLFEKEQAFGPLLFKGDGMHFFAVKDLTFKEYREASPSEGNPDRPFPWYSTSPIFVHPASSPYLLRSFLDFEGKKITHALSVGNPDHTNYSYDIKQGALLQFWRGDFVDATLMWESRGEPQVVKPLGSVIAVSTAPTIAFLENEQAVWPDSIPYEDFLQKGYSLGSDQRVTYKYVFKGQEFQDTFLSTQGGKALQRTVSTSGNTNNLYVRIADGAQIESLGNGVYAVDNRNYYIQVPKGVSVVSRKAGKGQELLVKLTSQNPSANYSIIW